MRDPTDDAPLSRQLWPADLAAEPFAAVFRKHFAALKAAHQAQPYEGVLIAAVDGNGVFDAHAHLRLPTSGIAHLIIGRHERCDVVLRDPSVSRRHARLIFRDHKWIIQDLRSTNGTIVNGTRVGRSEVRPGDLLALGDERLRVD